ncbi:MAG: DUF1700 domain-containing protein [Anaerofustis sp.]
MNKSQFLKQLAAKLEGLRQHEIDSTIFYYSEMIDDRVEDGMSEEEAVAALGNMDDIIREVMLSSPLSSLVKAKITPKTRPQTWEIVLLVLGFPVWFSLLLTFVCIIFSVYITIWAVIVGLYAAILGMTLGGLAGIIGSAILLFPTPHLALIGFGGSLVCIGLGILLFFPIREISVLLIKLTGKFLRWIKSLFIKKEAK